MNGTGSPTVVFESGLGDGKDSFERQIKSLSSEATLFFYDRPGYGGAAFWNSDADGERTGEEVASHLHDLLGEAGAQPPYVLVGHSIGGLYVLSFAKLYPDEVAGIVLVDSRPAGFTEACRASNSGLCEPPSFLTALFPTHQKAEMNGVGATERFAASPEDLGDIPVTVISSARPPAGSAMDFQTIWEQMQSDFAMRAEKGRFVHADGASHYIHHERAELVDKEIRRIITAARRGPTVSD